MSFTFLTGTATQLRGLAWTALSATGNVAAGTFADDGGGGGTLTYTLGADVPCRLDPLTTAPGVTGGRIDERSTHLLTVPAGTSLNVTSRFHVGGGTFEVTALRERTGASVLTAEVTSI
jgi:hypothetical protein